MRIRDEGTGSRRPEKNGAKDSEMEHATVRGNPGIGDTKNGGSGNRTIDNTKIAEERGTQGQTYEVRRNSEIEHAKATGLPGDWGYQKRSETESDD